MHDETDELVLSLSWEISWPNKAQQASVIKVLISICTVLCTST